MIQAAFLLTQELHAQAGKALSPGQPRCTQWIYAILAHHSEPLFLLKTQNHSLLVINGPAPSQLNSQVHL